MCCCVSTWRLTVCLACCAVTKLESAIQSVNWNGSSQSTRWNGNSHSQSAGWNGSSRSQSTGWHGASHGQDSYAAYAQPPELEEEEDDEDEEAGDTFMVSSSDLRWQLGWSAHMCSPAAVMCCGHLLLDWQDTCRQHISFLVALCRWAANFASWVAAGKSVPFPEYLATPAHYCQASGVLSCPALAVARALQAAQQALGCPVH